MSFIRVAHGRRLASAIHLTILYDSSIANTASATEMRFTCYSVDQESSNEHGFRR